MFCIVLWVIKGAMGNKIYETRLFYKFTRGVLDRLKKGSNSQIPLIIKSGFSTLFSIISKVVSPDKTQQVEIPAVFPIFISV